MQEDPDYRAAFAVAKEEAAEALEDSMADLAFDGNVTAGIFMLKGALPDKYRERATYEHTGKDGKPLIDVASVRAYLQSVRGK